MCLVPGFRTAQATAASGAPDHWEPYQRRIKRVEALIMSAYLAGVNTRQVKRVLFALFRGEPSA
ncbi:MAG: hypothetical protein F4Z10_07520 [Synechococcus sp. SB0666_bin_14]|nr:hypothetical protein [Synechococcus sp. SB0666_bin_14]MYA90433.1 hypothetical protein [Synechococcus sp. SB0663_bin_10]MYG47690.1 hypothetical protein [Synechococcus sp. SB0675_bin_6]MYJ59133.1 hypothetical protein [Synechococcus sp. SB0672_bin_6]MYK91180.1 hypothetical protein [Synechococcus sp. SB0669_bin_8]